MIDCQFQFVIDELFKWNSGQTSIQKQDIGGRFVVIMFILGDAVGQNIRAEPFDHLTLREAERAAYL